MASRKDGNAEANYYQGDGGGDDGRGTRKDLSEDESCDVEALDASNSSTRSLNRQ